MSFLSFTEKSNRTLSEFDFLHDPSDKNSKLGVGSFSTVKLAREKKSGKLFALKMVSINPAKVSSSDLHNLRTEIHIHKKLEHPNIVKFYDFIRHENNVFLILDYCENGNLYSFMHRKKQLSENEVFRFFYQTTLAIQYLHENDILHRDIKPENLLLDKSFNIKLCDFGWSAQRINEKRLTFCGTYEYMAPEIINKKPYDYRVDIWSLGVLLYELLHREPPYKGRSLPEISNSIQKTTIHYSSNINPDAKELIKLILKQNPNERPPITDMLAHPWVKSHLGKEELAANPPPKVQEVASPRNGKFQQQQAQQAPSQSSTHSQSQSQPPNKPHEEPVKEKPRPKNISTERELTLESPGVFKIKSPSNQGKYDPENYKPKALQDHNSMLNLKTLNDQFPSSGNPNSKSNLAKHIMENLQFDGKKTPSAVADRKKKIFESGLLSPTFKHKLSNIISQLSVQTTTHKASGDGIHMMSSSRSPTHQKANTIFNDITSTRKEFENMYTDNGNMHFYKASTSGLNLQNLSPTSFKKLPLEMFKSNPQTTKAIHQSKSILGKKINLKEDIPPMGASLSSSNLTNRNRREVARSDMASLQMSENFRSMEEGRSRSPNYANPLGMVDQNRHNKEEGTGIPFNQFYKGLEHKRKSNLKASEDYSNVSGKQFSISETKQSFSKERGEFILKENKSPGGGMERMYSPRAPLLKENYQGS